MRTGALPFKTWRFIIDMLRATGLSSLWEHADYLERQLEQHPPDQEIVALSLTDDVFLRSSTWARWQLGIAWPDAG